LIGAGGHDAVFVFVLSEEARIAVESLWSEWHKSGGTYVCPLTLHSSKGGVDGGIRIEEMTC
jgi:hypothetical protein